MSVTAAVLLDVMDLSGVFCVADSGVLQDAILWNSMGMHTCSLWFSNMHNWHADSSRRSIVQLNRERTAPRDLKPNLSQLLHLVQFFSELVIFICKQLKRPVAFRKVHFNEVDSD